MRIIFGIALVAAMSAPLSAQQGGLRTALSTRATTTVQLNYPRVQGQPAQPGLTITIDYGQPHARGRDVPTELATDGTIWRTGANASTTFRSEVDLTIGGIAVPKGAYSVYTIRQGGQYFLILNNNTGQWGTEYDAARDHARIPLRARTKGEVQESLQIAMVPADAQSARGVLAIIWGKLELSTDWSLR